MEITSENVQICWAYYEGYKQSFYKRHYSNAEPIKFEDWCEINLVECPNCGEIVLSDETIGTDDVCLECADNGYYE